MQLSEQGVEQSQNQGQHRSLYIDSVKAFGMLLVFYGHFLQQLFDISPEPAIAPQFKWVYSFHMPLFFLLAGIFWKSRKALTFKAFLKSRVKTRLYPTLYFSALAFPFWAIDFVLNGRPDLRLYETGFSYLWGSPVMNFMTWFLVCLATTETLLYGFERWIDFGNRKQVAWLAGGLLLLGLPLSLYNPIFVILGDNIHHLHWTNFWYLGEAVSAAGFYLLGYLFKPQLLSAQFSRRNNLIIMVSALAVSLATFDLNQGPFSDVTPSKGAVMAIAAHGNHALFVVSALAGIAATLCFFRTLRLDTPWIRFVGKNTLVYLGLNGLFFHFINHYLIRTIGYYPQQPLSVFAYASVFSIVTMLLCVPSILLINRYGSHYLGRSQSSKIQDLERSIQA